MTAEVQCEPQIGDGLNGFGEATRVGVIGDGDDGSVFNEPLCDTYSAAESSQPHDQHALTDRRRRRAAHDDVLVECIGNSPLRSRLAFRQSHRGPIAWRRVAWANLFARAS